MNRGLITGLASVAVAVAILFGAHALIGKPQTDICTNRIDSRVSAPDGKADAVAYTRDCGRDGGLSAHVSVIEPGTALANLPGNVYRATLKPEAPDNAATWARVGWLASDKLVVVHDMDAQAFQAERQRGAIAIQYGEMMAPPSLEDIAEAAAANLE
jgi:hypothetical protein